MASASASSASNRIKRFLLIFSLLYSYFLILKLRLFSSRRLMSDSKFPYRAIFFFFFSHPIPIKIGYLAPAGVKILASCSCFQLASRVSPGKIAKSRIPLNLLWTLCLAGCGIWLFFLVILGMQAENRSRMQGF